MGAGAPLAAGVLAAEGSGWDRGGGEQRGKKWPDLSSILEAEPAGLAGTLHVGWRERQEAKMTWRCSVPQCPHLYGGEVTMSHVMQKTPRS